MLRRLRRWILLFAAAVVLNWLWARRLSDNDIQEAFENASDPGNVRDKLQTPQPDEAAAKGLEKLIPVSLSDAHHQSSFKGFPHIQHDFDASGGAQIERLAAVREAFEHSWNGYKKYAWLKDELAPASAGYRSTLSGWAATLVDSLDTLWLMGLRDEFDEAVKVVADIDFNNPDGLPINVFETTIRYLGGLLGAYDISTAQYPVLLKKATEVGDMLLEAFKTPNGLPVLRWNKISVEVAPGDAVTSELGSLCLEFIRISQLTGDAKYSDAVQRITDCICSQQMSTLVPGLLPTTVNARECDFSQGVEFSLGAYIDSAYEYMPKTYQLLGGRAKQYQEMYVRALSPIKEHLLFRPMTPTGADILMAGTLKVFGQQHTEFNAQMQHLACSAGGMIALASKLFSQPSDLAVAEKLTHGCIWASNVTQTGIVPESFHVVPATLGKDRWDEEAWGLSMLMKNSFDEKPSDKQFPMDRRLKLKSERLRMPKGIVAFGSRQYQLRPEAIESIFVSYRITGDESLRDHAWRMFQAIVEQTRTEYAFSNIEDVTVNNSRKLDKMESYWMAETLKYFYLIFSSPDVLSLDGWVLNTEAHPFRLDHARANT